MKRSPVLGICPSLGRKSKNFAFLLASFLAFGKISASETDFSLCSQKEYGGNFAEYPVQSIKLTDGGFAAIGASRSFSYDGNRQAVYMVRVHENGDTAFTRHWGGEYREGMIPAKDEGIAIHECEDGGFLIAAHFKTDVTTSKLWLIRTDEKGDSIWASTLSEQVDRYNPFLIEDSPNKGFILAFTGDRGSDLRDDVRLIHMDSTGRQISARYHGVELGSSSLRYGYNQCALILERTSDTTYTIVAANQPERNTLSTLWSFSVNKSLEKLDEFFGELITDKRIIRAKDGGFLTFFDVPANSGFANTSTSYARVVLAKADSLGYIEWYKQHNASHPPYSNVIDIIQSTDGSLWLAGERILQLC